MEVRLLFFTGTGKMTPEDWDKLCIYSIIPSATIEKSNEKDILINHIDKSK